MIFKRFIVFAVGSPGKKHCVLLKNLSEDFMFQDLLGYLIKCGSLSPTPGLLNHNLWV